jgi:hypothetical protein
MFSEARSDRASLGGAGLAMAGNGWMVLGQVRFLATRFLGSAGHGTSVLGAASLGWARHGSAWRGWGSGDWQAPEFEPPASTRGRARPRRVRHRGARLGRAVLGMVPQGMDGCGGLRGGSTPPAPAAQGLAGCGAVWRCAAVQGLADRGWSWLGLARRWLGNARRGKGIQRVDGLGCGSTPRPPRMARQGWARRGHAGLGPAVLCVAVLGGERRADGLRWGSTPWRPHKVGRGQVGHGIAGRGTAGQCGAWQGHPSGWRGATEVRALSTSRTAWSRMAGRGSAVHGRAGLGKAWLRWARWGTAGYGTNSGGWQPSRFEVATPAHRVRSGKAWHGICWPR